jgi:hypothetical protein
VILLLVHWASAAAEHINAFVITITIVFMWLLPFKTGNLISDHLRVSVALKIVRALHQELDKPVSWTAVGFKAAATLARIPARACAAAKRTNAAITATHIDTRYAAPATETAVTKKCSARVLTNNVLRQ